jgi:NADH dehydrogenase
VVRIVVIGGGFAGLWSALGAARKLDECGVPVDRVEVVLVNRDAYHGIRVRNYERDLSDVRVPLPLVLDPAGVKRVEGSVVELDLSARYVAVEGAGGRVALPYDRLVMAAGSELYRPELPGLREHAFSVDTYAEAARLDDHLKHLPLRADVPGRYTAIVVGAGLTGIEAVCELPDRLRAVGGGGAVRVILADHAPRVGSDMGEEARPVIEEALRCLGVEARVAVGVRGIDADGVVLDSGERIPALTTVWTAGMRASPLTGCFPVLRDRAGRLPVDEFLRVKGIEGVFAAGDCAWMLIDGTHPCVMSCQQGRPMGRFAGHNVVCDLLGLPPLPLRVDYYVTILDLGPGGAVYTEGWERQVVSTGAAAKKTKQEINCIRIYPPRTGDRRAILDAAAPIVQTRPALHH